MNRAGSNPLDLESFNRFLRQLEERPLPPEPDELTATRGELRLAGALYSLLP